MGPAQSSNTSGGGGNTSSGSTGAASSSSRRRAQQAQAVVSESVFDVISSGDTAQLRFLLGAIREFNINEIGPAGHQPLHHAVHGTVNTCALVRALVESGANINALNDDGETPLIIAVAADREDVVKLLLELGADVDAPSKNGAVPLGYALAKRCKAVLPHILLKKPNVNFLTEDGESILHAAVSFGDVSIVDAVLHDMRVYPGGRVQLPPPLAAVVTSDGGGGGEPHQDSAATAADGESSTSTREDGGYQQWTHTASLMDARTLSRGDCPLATAVHTALNGSNSVSVRTRATEVGQLLVTVRTDMLLEDHLDMTRSISSG